MKLKFYLSLFFLLCLSLFFFSCEEEDKKPSDPNVVTNQFIYQVMKGEGWYLWNDKVPEIKPESYTNPNDYLYALMYKDLDKWSFLIDEESYLSLFERGEYFGLGFSYNFHSDGSLRVAYVFDDSPMSRAGVQRGYKILKISGKTVDEIHQNNLWESVFGDNAEGVSVTMELEDLEGTIVNVTVQKETVTQNTVLYREVYEREGVKIGYIVFQSFISPSIDELNKAFGYFKENNVTELIVDLRYNTGGQMNVAEHFGNLIAGNTAAGKLFAQLEFNELHESESEKSDNKYHFEAETNTIDVTKVVFIASKRSASASEALINGTKPFVETVQVGDNTYGKPVGMSGFQYEDQLLFPITFRVINADGEADYFDGLLADAYVEDGLDKPFGDSEEAMFKEAMYYLENGSFSGISKRKTKTREVPEMTGFRNQIGAY